MSEEKLSIHQAAAALLTTLDAPRGTVTTMVDIDERKGEVIRVLVSAAYGYSPLDIPSTFMGYPVLVKRQPAVHAFGARR